GDRDPGDGEPPILRSACHCRRYSQRQRSSTAASLGPRQSTGTLTRAGQFSLQLRVCFGTFADVRMIVAIGTLFIGISTALAQEQERRLMDRLLKPDASLANPAQNKKFSGNHATSFDKTARTHNFYSSRKSPAK